MSTSNSSSSGVSTVNLAALSTRINYYYVVTVVPVGILTNLISIAVFFRKTLSVTNMGLFNLLISVANSITLIYYLFVSESSLVFNYDLSTSSDFACKILMALRRVIRELAPIIEMVMTFERFMSVYFPRRFGFIQKRSFLLSLISIIFALFCIFSFENFFYYLEDNLNGKKSCTGVPLVTVSSNLVSATLRTFLPFSIMFTMNILMVRRLITRRLIRSSSSSSKSRREYQFTISVVSMNALFLILNLPVSIGYILQVIFSDPSSHVTQVINFYWNVAYLIATSHYVLTNMTNFVFNRLFRQELMKILVGDRLESSQSPSSASRPPTTTVENLDRVK